MKAGDQKVTKIEQEEKCMLLTIASYHTTAGASKRRKKTERLHRNVSSLKEFSMNLQCPSNLWTGYSAPPCAEMAQLVPAPKAVCIVYPASTPSFLQD